MPGNAWWRLLWHPNPDLLYEKPRCFSRECRWARPVCLNSIWAWRGYPLPEIRACPERFEKQLVGGGDAMVHARCHTWGQLILQDLFRKEL